MKVKNYLRSLWPVYLLAAFVFLALTQGTGRTVTTIAQNLPIDRDCCIIIDAGHGGEDGGAVSCTGALESHINLEISLRLNDLFCLLGYDTKMIRTTDVSVYKEGDTIAARKISDLKQRVNIINDTDDGLLVSIHQNTFPQGKYSGAQVFYNGISGGKELATCMQDYFMNTVNRGSNRQCKEADGIYLMQNVNCPGVLVECGFLSNPSEEARLRDPQYQKKLCCVIVTAVNAYLNT